MLYINMLYIMNKYELEERKIGTEIAGRNINSSDNLVIPV